MKFAPAPSKKRRANVRRAATPRRLAATVRSHTAGRRRAAAAIAWICRIILVSAAVGGAVYGGTALLNKYLWSNPDYRIAEIRARSDGGLTRDQILAAAGFSEGDNIFSVNLAVAERNLLRIPEVEEARLERIPPNRVQIAIRERKAIARLVPRSHPSATRPPEGPQDLGIVVDASGIPYMPLNRPPLYYTLPEIRGIAPDILNMGQPVACHELGAALELLTRNADNPRYEILSVDLSRGWCMEVTDRSRMVATFGLDNIERQLAALNRILDYSDQSRRPIRTVNVMVERNVPVLFGAPEDPATASPEDPVLTEDSPPAAPLAKPAKADPVKTAKADLPKSVESASAKLSKARNPKPTATKPVPPKAVKAEPVAAVKAEPVQPPPAAKPDSAKRSPFQRLFKPSR